MNKPKLLLAGLTAVCIPAFSATTADGITFASKAPYVSGAVIVSPAKGGEYVYSARPQSDGRGTLRFMLGHPPRQNYDLFSAQDEAALWRTREAQREVVAAAEQRARVRPVRRHVGPQLNWPKVVLVGDKTCVPQTAFANGSDWQQHLVCWSEGDRRVE